MVKIGTLVNQLRLRPERFSLALKKARESLKGFASQEPESRSQLADLIKRTGGAPDGKRMR